MPQIKNILHSYFEEKELGESGGLYSDFYQAKIGGYSFLLPNTQGRKRALIRHDVHHLLTDYNVDFLGELEIGGWEVGSGCGNYWGIWLLNLIGMGTGVFLIPKRTFKAFLHGRRSSNLYHTKLSQEEVGEMKLEEIRDIIKFYPDIVKANFLDLMYFILWTILAWIVIILSPPYYLCSLIFLWIKNKTKPILIQRI